jgi:hypothetical protein
MTYLLEGALERGLPQIWIDELRRHAATAAPATPAVSTALKIGFRANPGVQVRAASAFYPPPPEIDGEDAPHLMSSADDPRRGRRAAW